MNSHYHIDNPTLYTSGYLVANPKGYTKHYYAGSERVSSAIGLGGLGNINDPLPIEFGGSWDEKSGSLMEEMNRTIVECLKNEYKIEASLKFLHDMKEAAAGTMDRYFYHPDHLGSSSWITDGKGYAIQHLHYLLLKSFAFFPPWRSVKKIYFLYTHCLRRFGEDWVDQRNASWSAPYTFSGKEKDVETGYSYFGARYYDSGLSIWLSVDPMSDKYPNLTPYAYCANNPVILVDPDGRIIRPYNEVSKTYMMNYLSKQFGNDNKLFYFNKYNELKINRREYSRYMKTASNEQKILLKGLKEAIKSDKTLIVFINKNSDKFAVTENQSHYNEQGDLREQFLDFNVTIGSSGITLKYSKANYYYLFMNDEAAKSDYCEAEPRIIGKDDVCPQQTGGEASNVFIHEVLDEFLNYYDKKIINDNTSSKKEKVYYQNKALKNLKLKERTGNDHQ